MDFIVKNWSHITVLLGVIGVIAKMWIDYCLENAKMQVEYATKIRYEQYKVYVRAYNYFYKDTHILAERF